jgi:hypothetical protein
MTFKVLEKKRQYHGDYMRERRKGLTSHPLNPEEETVKIDPTRPYRDYSIRIAGVWYRVTVQDGKLFDRNSGRFLLLGIETTELRNPIQRLFTDVSKGFLRDESAFYFFLV